MEWPKTISDGGSTSNRRPEIAHYFIFPSNLSSDVITFSKLSSNELFPFFKSESRRRFGPYRLFELV